MTPGQIDFGAIRMRLAGAHPRARLEGLDLLPGKSYYYIGNDPRKWRTGVPQYGRVAYRDVYPGVDVIFYGRTDQLEYDLILEPHADLSGVRLRFEGARKLAVEANGDLRIESRHGVLRQKRPLIYQEIGGERSELAGRYVVSGREVRFAVNGYDPEQRLVIDPVIVYATYFGGSGDDYPGGIAVDGSGNTYFSGYTTSTNFPTHPAQTGSTAKGGMDAFVVKLDPAAQHVLYSVVLGGSSYDAAIAIAVDPAGNAYVTGATASSDFPTRNAYQGSRAGGWDAFVAKLDPSGNLIYSTYLGGGQLQPCHCSNTSYGASNPMDAGTAIVADASGNAYVAGITYSADFPFTVGLRTHTPNWGEAFVAGFGPAGSFLWSTQIGGSAYDDVDSIALGSGGTLWVAGQTSSPDLPVTAGAVQSKFGGSGGHPGRTMGIGDGWVAKINPTAGPQNVIAALTYLGGSMDDQILSIHPDAADNLYVGGHTLSSNFPVTAGAYQTSYAGGSDLGDGFLAKLNPTLTSLTFSTFFGGALDDAVSAVGVDSAGRPWVLGATQSPNLTPASLGSNPTALQVGFQGPIDAFGLELNATGTSALYFSYMSGGLGALPSTVTTNVTGLAIDAADAVYCMSIANLVSVVPGPTVVQPTPAGGLDVFLMKLIFPPPPAISSLSPATMTASTTALTSLTINGSNFSTIGGHLQFTDPNGAATFSTSHPERVVSVTAAQWVYQVNNGGTTGTWRVQVVNADSQTSNTASFTVTAAAPPPTASTGSATSITANSATLGGTVNPNGLDTHVSFLYGTSSSLSGASQTGSQDLGSGASASSVSANVTGLAANTTYYFQLQATSTAGTAAGSIVSFKTSTATPANPVQITKINVAAGGVDIAQNTWIEIHGTGLAPASVPAAGTTWSSAPEFASGRMPTSLAGVSVNVDGKPAYIYYVSATQVNVLTPLDSTMGQVQVTLTNGSNTSDPFAVNLKTVAPAFLQFGSGPYIAGRHADYSLLGQASMSVPGYTFTPAQPGETILLYGAGFGMPGSILTEGSATQLGALVNLPAITIGGSPATVLYAGVISPGLYQFNVVVPDTAATGDNAVVATYGGASTPAGAMISVSR